ncbi:MAG: right-handed parallel beta-helix repeat-containing protein [Candidatus Cloacimonetes bacterium]|jgi:predicted outer membrane repeat protein|nr:right-handed parallel beta-helix repeat-containing protein [Candidatus Cloacimonadota bacterium]
MKLIIWLKLVYIFVILILLISCSNDVTGTQTIYVPADYPTIQEAIDEANDGAEITVDPGEYFERIDFGGKAIKVQSLYASTADDIFIATTIINAESLNSVVTFRSQETNSSELNGFTLINGNAGIGGGISCRGNSSPRISNMIIKDNAANFGAGIGCYSNSNPVLNNITIKNNTANHGNGGGICSYSSHPILDEILIYDNYAENGGGVFLNNSSLTMTNVSILNNVASYSGGGIYMVQSSTLSQNCIIAENYGWTGGAVYCWDTSTLMLGNSILYNNDAKVADGIFMMNGCEGELMNSIMWDNGDVEIMFASIDLENRMIMAYSNIDGYDNKIITANNGEIVWIDGNISSNPVFVNPNNLDFHLSVISPCINSGNPLQIFNDIDGSRNDIGAFGGENGNW